MFLKKKKNVMAESTTNDRSQPTDRQTATASLVRRAGQRCDVYARVLWTVVRCRPTSGHTAVFGEQRLGEIMSLHRPIKSVEKQAVLCVIKRYYYR